MPGQPATPARSRPAARLRHAGAVTATVVTTVTSLLATVATTATATPPPVPAMAASSPIEPLSAYQPQSTCDPTAKPGVKAFRNLVLTAYPGTGDDGITRACSSGGRSEHKEGRAWDWAVTYTDPVQRAKAAELLKWLLAPDAAGHSYAMARRLGIMYIIWNDRIWGSYQAAEGWRPYTGPDPHRTHVHFSFSWAGAEGTTSYWTHVATVADPAPPALSAPPSHGAPVLSDRRLPRSVTVPAGRDSLVTSFALPARHRYQLVVSRTWSYGLGTADGSCSAWPSDHRWHAASEWETKTHRRYHHLDLTVNGRSAWVPTFDTGGGCNTLTHTYAMTYAPTTTARLRLQLVDDYRGDDRGSITVQIRPIAKAVGVRIPVVGPSRLPVSVSVSARTAVTTAPFVLQPGHDYQLAVTGQWRYGGGAMVADGGCSVWPGDRAWHASSAWPSLGRSHLRLTVNGRSGWSPLVDDGHGCDDAHTYVMRWHVATVQALRLALADDYRGDNSGGVRLTIRDLGHALAPPAVAVPSGPLSVDVPAGSTGVSTRFALQGGTTYRLTASGVYAYGSWPMVADAECSVWPSDRRWHKRSAYADATGWGNHLDLVVEGRSDWVPATGDDHGCDTGHVYTMTLTPRRSGPVTVRVLDDYLGDNAGALHLTVAPVPSTA